MAILQPLTVEQQTTLLENYQIDNALAKKLVNKLANYIGTYELPNRKGFTFNTGDAEVKFVILSNDEDTIKIIYINAGGEEKLTGSVIVEEAGKKILRAYDVVDDEVLKTVEKEVTEEFLNDVKENDLSRELPESREEVVAQATCIYGNWCGPGCGSGDPISAVDKCCKYHDLCYRSYGYFACSCDRKLNDCLAPYVRAGSEWAIAVSGWFMMQPCNPLA